MSITNKNCTPTLAALNLVLPLGSIHDQVSITNKNCTPTLAALNLVLPLGSIQDEVSNSNKHWSPTFACTPKPCLLLGVSRIRWVEPTSTAPSPSGDSRTPPRASRYFGTKSKRYPELKLVVLPHSFFPSWILFKFLIDIFPDIYRL